MRKLIDKDAMPLAAPSVVVVVEILRAVLLLESSVKQYNISTKFVWMMQGYYRVQSTVPIVFSTHLVL